MFSFRYEKCTENIINYFQKKKKRVILLEVEDLLEDDLSDANQ
jgi:hypothetical protein